jgi:glutamyl-tRNA reductase
MDEKEILKAVDLAIENAKRYLAEQDFAAASVSLSWAADELNEMIVEKLQGGNDGSHNDA